MHRNSELLFEKYAKPLFKKQMRVLEIGPDMHPSKYKQIVGTHEITWETLDIFKSENLDYVAESEYRLPIPNDTFDIVLSGQVIEHVKKIWLWIKELSRVCKPGGYVVTINPVNWPYHEAPVDCWRIYPEGMKAIYDEAHLHVLLSKREIFNVSTCPNLFLRVLDFRKIFLGLNIFAGTMLRKSAWHDSMAEDTITIGIKRD